MLVIAIVKEELDCRSAHLGALSTFEGLNKKYVTFEHNSALFRSN